MTQKEQLLKIFDKLGMSDTYSWDTFVDDLLNNGVIVQPCKIGDIVYLIYNKKVYAGQVIQLRTFTTAGEVRTYGNALVQVEDMFYHDGRTEDFELSFAFEDFGDTRIAYFTKEEAEKALKERETNA